MGNKEPSMAFYRTFYDLASLLDEGDRKDALAAMLDYFFAGTEPCGLSRTAQVVFEGVRGRIDAAKTGAACAAKRWQHEDSPEDPPMGPTDGSDDATNASDPCMGPTNGTHDGTHIWDPPMGPTVQSESESRSKRSTTDESPNGDSCRETRRKATRPEVEEIVGYLNAKTGKRFKASSKATIRQINARFAEGYTVDDFRAVIDAKVAEWAGVVTRDGRSMDDYLAPETLFSTKFERYLNSGISVPSSRDGPGWYAEGSEEANEQARREAEAWFSSHQ